MPLSLTHACRITIVGLGLMTLAACATAPKTAQADSEAKQVVVTPETMKEAQKVAEAGDPDEMVCRRVKQTTTRFTKKVCMKRKQWRDMAQDARRGTAQTQQRSFDTGRGN